jgi:glycosyltransferase involved in cell wall biosynthesis
MKKLKLLISAYACEPGKGSEPGVGWSWVAQMSQFHDLWVITRANNREAIEKTNLDWVRKVHWIYFDLPPRLTFWKKGSRGVHAYYYFWQIGAWLKAKKLLREVSFDLIHHVTFGQYWIPSWLGLLERPFVFGPVGGGEDTPQPLLASLTPKQRQHESLRTLLRNIARFDPIANVTLGRSTFVAATEDTLSQAKSFRPKLEFVLPQCAMTREEIATFNHLRPKSGGPFRLISIGRLVHWKGYHLSILAFAKLLKSIPDAEYWLINQGPEQEALERLAAEAGCGDKIKFLGRMKTLQDVYARLEQSDVLVHPALHEAFGNVCLETMASGRPVICFNRGGPALQVTPETGIAVEPGEVEESVERLTEAMQRLADDSQLRRSMGENARRRVADHFSWEEMAVQMNTIYEKTLAQN